MDDKHEVLCYLRDNQGKALRSAVSIEVFNRNQSASELDKMLKTILAGFVKVGKDRKWTLTSAGWEQANLMPADTPPAQQQPVSEGVARFKQIIADNPDCSTQRARQLFGSSLKDPLDPTWAEWRENNPEWYLREPKDWYAPDVELDQTNQYPMRYPTRPLTAKERATRPRTPEGWFRYAMGQPSASLEPYCAPMGMAAAECTNIIKVVRKVGMVAALEIFKADRIATAHRLVGIPVPERV